MGRELLIGFQDVAFLLSRASFAAHFLELMVGVVTFGTPHVLKLWLGVGKVMLPVKYFHSSQSSLCWPCFMEIMKLSES